MSTPVTPVITTAGLNAIFNDQHSGLKSTISQIAIGDAGYTPSADQTELRAEKVRVTARAAREIIPRQLRVEALLDGPEELWIREIGFWLDNGVLLAVWSDPDTPLAYKSASTDLLLALDLAIDALPPDQITVQSSGPDYNMYLADPLAQITASLAHQATEQLQHRFRSEDTFRALEEKDTAIIRQIDALSQRLTNSQRQAETNRLNMLSALTTAVANQATAHLNLLFKLSEKGVIS